MTQKTLTDNATCCAVCFEMLEAGETVTIDKDKDVICQDCA